VCSSDLGNRETFAWLAEPSRPGAVPDLAEAAAAVAA